MAIRAITFDFWMTLFEEFNRAERHQVRVEAFCAVTGADKGAVDTALQVAHEAFFRIHVEEKRTLAPGDAVTMVCRALDLDLDGETHGELATVFGTAIMEYPPVPITNALEAVRAAAELVPVGLISDSGMSPGTSLRRLLNQHGFTPYFGALSFSDEVGVAKPQAPMFEQTAAALGVQPNELLHLGDLDPTDIQGVHGVGGIGALFAGANDRFAANTLAEHTYFDWATFIEDLPKLIG